MTLIKTSLLNAIAVAIKMLTLLGLNKILAVYVGPAGYASLGQFQNVVQVITALASGSISTGVTKYTAEYHADEIKQHAIWRTTGTIALIGSLSIAILVVIFRQRLAEFFLQDDSLGSVFVWFAATLALFVINAQLLAILNGKKDIPGYVLANIGGSLASLLITTFMAIQLGLYGALVASAIYQSFSFFITLFICTRKSWFKLGYLFGAIDRSAAKNLGKFAAMALTSAICVPVSHVMVRNHLGTALGWEAAGYWEAMSRLSSAYLMLMTTTLSVYYLPRLSELRSALEIKNELSIGLAIILPFTALCSFTIYLLQDLIIETLFTREFFAMKSLFGWQTVGDTLKIGSWLFAYFILSKAAVKFYVLSEIFSAGLFYITTALLLEELHLQAAAVAHTITYLFYFLLLTFFARKTLQKSNL